MDTINRWFGHFTHWLSFIPEWFIISIGIIILGCILTILFSRYFHKLSHKKHIKHHAFKDAFVKGIRKPAILLIWFICIRWIMITTTEYVASPLLNHILYASQIILVLLGAWFLTSFTSHIEKNLNDPLKVSIDKKPDPTSLSAIKRLITVIIFIISALIIMQILGFSLTGLLAFGGVSGLAVAFGAQDLISNFFGAFIIYLDKPFAVGDWISSPDKQIEGTVQYIGWRHTCVMTFDKRPLYIPNAIFNKISILNPSRMINRRIKENIGLRYQDAGKVDQILANIKDYLMNNPEIASDQTLMVNFDHFGHSTLDFFIYCFTKTKDWATYHKVKQEVLLNIIEIIHEHGADIAYPTQTIEPSKVFTKLLPDTLTGKNT